jgi:uncharacterized protein HemY
VRKVIDSIHEWSVRLAGKWGLPVGLVWFALHNSKLRILPQIFSETVSNWMYIMLSIIGGILPYLAGLLGLFMLFLSVRSTVQDFKKWRRKRAREKTRKATISK